MSCHRDDIIKSTKESLNYMEYPASCSRCAHYRATTGNCHYNPTYAFETQKSNYCEAYSEW
jgi:hypothetical protein